MPGLTLVLGGASSGKTSRLIEMLADRYAADAFAPTLVLVPTARHADQLRRRLVARTGIAFGLDVTTFGLFAARYRQPGVLAPLEVANELLTRVVEERVAGGGPASRFLPIANTPGLASFVSTAVAELAADLIETEKFGAAASRTGDADLQALADIYAAYRDALTARGWRDPREAPAVASEALRNGAATPPLVLVDSIQFLRKGELDLVVALAERTDVWITLDPAAGARAAWTLEALARAVPGLQKLEVHAAALSAHVEAITASDTEAQLREIARSVKDRLTGDASLRPSDFAVVFRQVTPHLALARRVFSEAKLPLDPASGERLTERPFGAWLLRLLRLGSHGWRTREVAEVLAAGFTDADRWGVRAGDVELLRRVAREHHLWVGLDALRAVGDAVSSDLATRPRTDADRWHEAAAAWSRAIESFAAVLDPSAERTAGEHARLLDAALFGSTGWVRSSVDQYTTLDTEIGAFRAALSGFSVIDEMLSAPTTSLDVFVGDLESRMRRPSTLIREAGGVLLAPMHTLHGLRFAHVYLGGLSEGEFPAPRRTGALLDRDAREALVAAALDLPPEPRAAEDELWLTATTRAEQGLSLWRPRFDGSGRPAAASYYFESADVPVTDMDAAPAPERAASTRELAIGLARNWPGESRRPTHLPAWAHVVRVAAPVEQRRRSFASAGRFEGAVPNIDLSWLLEPERRWSPSRLESYLGCPFQFFASYALGLSELDDQQEQADAATRGTVMHAMLEDAIAPLVDRGAGLNTMTAPEVVDRIRSRGRITWDLAPEQYAFGRAALWRYEGDLALDQLASMVWREARLNEEIGVDAVVGGEQQFDATLVGTEPPMQISGRSDRVDSGPGLIQIVDYKTGRPIEEREVRSGRRLQLQLYALAARAQFGDVRLVARYAFLRPPQREWWIDSANAEHLDILNAAAEVAASVRRDVGAGAFQVSPQVTPCPSYCAFQHACRVNTFSRNKTWN